MRGSLSASVAAIGEPMFRPAGVFSSTLRAPSSVLGNSGALLALVVTETDSLSPSVKLAA